jgi:hypothetical protein
MEQIYEGDIPNEQFRVMITAFSNMMVHLADVSLQHFGVNIPPLFSQPVLVNVSHTLRRPLYLLETVISTVAAVRISLSHEHVGSTAALSNAAPTGAIAPVIYFSGALLKHI